MAIRVRSLGLIPDPPGLFDGIPKSDIARYFDVNIATIDQWRRAGMPRQLDGTGLEERAAYNLIECSEWLAKQRDKGATMPSVGKEEDGLLKREQRKIKELQRQQLEGTLVNSKAWVERMQAVVEGLRRGAESFQRSFGDEASETLNSIVDELETELLGEFSSD